VPPPGPPLEHQELVTGGWLDVSAQLSSSSQYWLQLTRGQPILREAARGFRDGDQLLMETDRSGFPRQGDFYFDLCVVRFPDGDPPLKLAAVSYHGEPEYESGWLSADPFDLAPDPKSLVTEQVY